MTSQSKTDSQMTLNVRLTRVVVQKPFSEGPATILDGVCHMLSVTATPIYPWGA